MTKSVGAAAIVLVFLSGWIPSGAISGGEPARPADRTLADQVESLLDDLDANQRAVRVQAEQDLLDLGPAILPLLPPPELLPSEAVRASVARIRTQLERRKARESVIASQVNLQGKHSLKTILDEISRQTGNSIDQSAVSPKTLERQLSLTFEKTPFWRALDETVKQAGLQYAFRTDAEAIVLRDEVIDGETDDELAVAYSGAFRLSVVNARLRPIAGRTDRQQLRIGMTVTPEPRLRSLFLKYAMADQKAASTAGPLAPQNPSAQYDLPLGDGGKHLRVSLDFEVPAATRLDSVRLSGRLTMQTAAGSEHIRFRDLRAERVARRRGGVTVRLERAATRPAEGDSREAVVQVTVTYDTGGPAFESHRTWIFHNEVWLEGEDGKRQSPDGYDTSLQRDGIVAVAYHFSDLADSLDKLQFVYVAPTLILDVPVEYDFPAVPVSPLRPE